MFPANHSFYEALSAQHGAVNQESFYAFMTTPQQSSYVEDVEYYTPDGNQNADEDYVLLSAERAQTQAEHRPVTRAYRAAETAAAGSRAHGNQHRVDKNSPLTAEGNLNRKPIKNNGATYNIPPRPAASANREIKSRVFEDVVMQIREGDEEYKQKAVFLCQYFSLPVIA